jgi:hypothetical protein
MPDLPVVELSSPQARVYARTACKVHSHCVQVPLGATLGKYSDIASVAASCLMLQWRECIAKAVRTLSTPALR